MWENSMVDIPALAAELTDDPLGRSYSGMSDSAAAVDLNTQNRVTSVDTIGGAELWNAIDTTEYNALSADDLRIIDHIGLLNNGIPIGAGNVKTQLFGVFGAGTTTRDNLIVLSVKQQSRAEELGILGSSLEIGSAHVAQARA